MKNEIISIDNFNKRKTATTDKGHEVSLLSIDEEKGVIKAAIDNECVASIFKIEPNQSFKSRLYGTLIYKSKR